MRLPRNKVIHHLELILTDLLRGVSLKDWAENIVVGLLKNAGQSAPPVKLSRELLQARRISDIRFKPGLHPIWGQLIIGDDGFEIVLSPTRQKKGFWHQFALAHEVAHTFFYNIEKWPPVKLVYLESGNLDLEWLCTYLAKCLFIPAIWLRHEIESFPQIGSEGFNLRILDELGKKFLVPWQIVAERIVEDLLLWNCIILNFTSSIEFRTSLDGGRRPVWRLDWLTMPSEGVGKLFIPFGRRTKEGRTKFPRAEGAIAEFIEGLIEKKNEIMPHQRKIPTKILNCGTTGNLGKFLSQLFKSDEVNVYIQSKTSPHNVLFDPEWAKQQSLVMCIPLQKVS